MTEPVDTVPALLEQADAYAERQNGDIASRRPSGFEWAGLVQQLAAALRRMGAELAAMTTDRDRWKTDAQRYGTHAENAAMHLKECEDWYKHTQHARDELEVALQRAREELAQLKATYEADK